MQKWIQGLLIAVTGLACFSPRFAAAHGVVGDRFFPPTIATDDPFAVDELSLPVVSYIKQSGADGDPSAHTLNAGFEFVKELYPHLAVGVSDHYQAIQPAHQKTLYGWENLEINVKYELWINELHEAIVSVGLTSEIGGTGTRHLGADSFTTFSPTLYYGKGFGDLPDSLGALKPLALTGTLAQSFPTSGQAPNVFEWGFAVEYSIPYLQQHVHDIGLPSPFSNMIPLVEFDLSTNENRAQHGQTTGTINPGVLWEARQFQLGVEAILPVNSHTGSHVGVTVQLQIFIDDLFPQVFGHPLFGGAQ